MLISTEKRFGSVAILLSEVTSPSKSEKKKHPKKKKKKRGPTYCS